MGPTKKAVLSPVSVPTIPGQSFNLDRVVSEAEAASIIGYSKDTLRREFQAGRAPPRVRLSGRRIGYRLSAIYAFLEAHSEQPGRKRGGLSMTAPDLLNRKQQAGSPLFSGNQRADRRPRTRPSGLGRAGEGP